MEPELDKLDTIAKRIKHIRGRMTQEEFAHSLGVHRSSIVRYEKGVSNPTSEFLKAMCRYYDIRPAWLLMGNGPIKEPVVNKEVRKDMAERLKKLIAGQNSIKFSLANGIDPLAMLGYLNGFMTPGVEHLIRIKRATDVTYDWLLEGKKVHRTILFDRDLADEIFVKLDKELKRHKQRLSSETRAKIFTSLYELYFGTDKEIDTVTIERLLAMHSEETK